jgi:hypothetical protein
LNKAGIDMEFPLRLFLFYARVLRQPRDDPGPAERCQMPGRDGNRGAVENRTLTNLVEQPYWQSAWVT